MRCLKTEGFHQSCPDNFDETLAFPMFSDMKCLKVQRFHLKGILIVSFTLILLKKISYLSPVAPNHLPSCLLIYLGVQGEEDGQEEGQETN